MVISTPTLPLKERSFTYLLKLGFSIYLPQPDILILTAKICRYNLQTEATSHENEKFEYTFVGKDLTCGTGYINFVRTYVISRRA